MTTNPTPNNAQIAAARAAEARATRGEAPRTRVAGPFAEMLLEAGFSPTSALACIDGFFCDKASRSDFKALVGAKTFNAFLRASRKACRAAGA